MALDVVNHRLLPPRYSIEVIVWFSPVGTGVQIPACAGALAVAATTMAAATSRRHVLACICSPL